MRTFYDLLADTRSRCTEFMRVRETQWWINLSKHFCLRPCTLRGNFPSFLKLPEWHKGKKYTCMTTHFNYTTSCKESQVTYRKLELLTKYNWNVCMMAYCVPILYHTKVWPLFYFSAPTNMTARGDFLFVSLFVSHHHLFLLLVLLDLVLLLIIFLSLPQC